MTAVTAELLDVKCEVVQASERRLQHGNSRHRKHRILIVDSDRNANKALALRLKLAGFLCATATNPSDALRILQLERFDAIIAELRMSEFSGVNLLREVRRVHASIAFLFLASSNDAYDAINAMKDGADDCLIKPLIAKDLLRNIRKAVEKRLEKGNLASEAPPNNIQGRADGCLWLDQESGELENTLTMLGAALDLRDSEIAGHSRRVCMYALEIAQRMECSEKELQVLRQGALLHDIGKIAIPDAILWKPGPLTDEEWTIMQSHVVTGYELIKDVPALKSAAELVVTHHERYDGSGYPNGLKGQQIPLCARIFAVADALDAMTTYRPYQAPVPLALAINEIRRQSGRAFDPNIVQAFLEIPESTLDSIYVLHETNGRAGRREWQRAGVARA
jgi:putative nucleotidyltransferase with HDIG domain